MKYLISSIQNCSYIPYKAVDSAPAGTIPIKSVFNSTQSHDIVNADDRNKVNWGASSSALPSVFSGVFTRSQEDAMSDVVLSQEPLEILNHSPVLADIGNSAATPLSPPCVGPIQGEHFEKWYTYNIQWDGDLASGKNAPPEMELQTVLAMISRDYSCIECAHQPRVLDRAQSFASLCNIDPLVWSVMVTFNGKPMTFLPREMHHVVTKAFFSKEYNPITNLDIQAWQSYTKNSEGKINTAIRASFATNRKINKFTFKRIVNLRGGLNPRKRTGKRLISPQIFIRPEWLGISNERKERITVEHIRSWNEKKDMADYGIESYLYLSHTQLPYPQETVCSWRQYEKETGILNMSDFAQRHGLSLKLVITLADGIKNWDRLPASTQRNYAMTAFASNHSLDPSAWCFFAWSNERTMLRSRVSEGERVLQMLQTLQMDQMDQMQQIQKMTEIQQMEQVEQMEQIRQIEERLLTMRAELKEKIKDAMRVS